MSDGIPCLWMRGGTSKGPFFLRSDLPSDPAQRDALLVEIMGSGHPLQIDGIGGGSTLSSKVAIVGPSGAGKSTLFHLLLRFYDPASGVISVDGVPVREADPSAVRSRIALVPQQPALFASSAADNIRYGRLDATDEEVLEAAKATYVDRFVHTLPDGYDTVIEQDAANVSAGERQLITIARAFLAQPSILILDEATSSVDTRTEVLVQGAMAALRSDRTSFVIAHRLSTIRDADVILVMEDGDIVEQGSHDQLLAARGAYFRLYRSQFQGGEQAEEQDDDGAPAAREDAR